MGDGGEIVHVESGARCGRATDFRARVVDDGQPGANEVLSGHCVIPPRGIWFESDTHWGYP